QRDGAGLLRARWLRDPSGRPDSCVNIAKSEAPRDTSTNRWPAEVPDRCPSQVEVAERLEHLAAARSRPPRRGREGGSPVPLVSPSSTVYKYRFGGGGPGA